MPAKNRKGPGGGSVPIKKKSAPKREPSESSDISTLSPAKSARSNLDAEEDNGEQASGTVNTEVNDVIGTEGGGAGESMEVDDEYAGIDLDEAARAIAADMDLEDLIQGQYGVDGTEGAGQGEADGNEAGEEEAGDDEDEDEDEDGDGDGEDDEDDDDEDDGDDEEEGDDDDEEDGEDGEEGAEEDGEEGLAASNNGDADGTSTTYRYPAAVPEFKDLSEIEKKFKIARFVSCSKADCDCTGLIPPSGSNIVISPREEVEGSLKQSRNSASELGWWKACGSCGHGWEGESGHVFPANLPKDEKARRSRVVGRIEEILQDEGKLTTFPTPHTESITSLLRQLSSFQKPTGGKKPAMPLPPAIDLTGDGSAPFTPGEDVDTPGAGGSDDERPNKRSKRDGSREGAVEDGEIDNDQAMEEAGGKQTKSHGKKPGGKTAGKGTKPRTVVRGSRGLIPMEIDAEGNQHVAGRLPDSAVAAAAEEDDEEDDVPLAKRPQLDEGERRRREVIKEKEREREDEVLRRLAKGSNVDEGADGLEGTGPVVDVEIWEGVELPKLPPRPAMIEQQKEEIRLIVVGTRGADRVGAILLIGLKNLFQRQLPKMPREYITRLVLDKNHISMAIVKRGWKVVGGICYRPFESRGFAEIVFCAVDSSEQIKGYGSHLMNSLKDHVRKAHPTINHFLTYADNYAVGYFKKQGFTKEITLPRDRWVGYIKDYEGGTIMQCTMLPKVKYMDVHQMLADQKAAVLAKIRTISRSHIVRPGLSIFKDRKPGQEIKLSKAEVPGLAESGWDPEIDAIMRQPRRNPDHVLLQHVLNDLQNEPSSWPFTKPVDKNVVEDYYSVIAEPMDLSTMEYKLENNHYANIEEFLRDAQLMFNNCRQYNGSVSTYTTQANRLEKALDRIMKARKSSVTG